VQVLDGGDDETDLAGADARDLLGRGMSLPRSVIWYSLSLPMKRIFWPLRSSPSTTRT
jgi:hypothetical protein